MLDADGQLRHRPHPPPLPSSTASAPSSSPLALRRALSVTSSPMYDAAAAMRVRRWIEARSVADVSNCRPVLNAEIQQGLALRKSNSTNDRSVVVKRQ